MNYFRAAEQLVFQTLTAIKKPWGSLSSQGLS